MQCEGHVISLCNQYVQHTFIYVFFTLMGRHAAHHQNKSSPPLHGIMRTCGVEIGPSGDRRILLERLLKKTSKKTLKKTLKKS